MKRLLLLLAVLLLLTSCEDFGKYSRVTYNNGIEAAQSLCKDHGGLHAMSSQTATGTDATQRVWAKCQDGVLIDSWLEVKDSE